MPPPVSLVKIIAEGICKQLNDELGDENLKTYRDSPCVEDYAQLSHFFEFTAIGSFAHLAVAFDFELINEPRKEIHADI